MDTDEILYKFEEASDNLMSILVAIDDEGSPNFDEERYNAYNAVDRAYEAVQAARKFWRGY